MNKEIVVDKTKIIATIGPASSSKETLRKMILKGLDVCRLNFSHGSHNDHQKVIDCIRELNDELGTNISILGDLQGPKIRVGEIDENAMELKNGDMVKFHSSEMLGKDLEVSITYHEFPKDVKSGEKIQIDDGKILLEIVETNKDDLVKAKVIHGGILKSKKGINLPNTKISLPCLTEKDLNDLDFALRNDIPWIALSFVRSAEDIIELRHVIKSKKEENQPLIIAKIEKPEALNDIDNIINETDGIMVARGDLGIEIPLQEVPMTQKMLVKKCLLASKPIIIATQMMEGMINNYNPTRAEVNDVANSVMDGADALMLSGETSVGNYPVEVVETMHKIINHVELFEDIYHKNTPSDVSDNDRFISDSIIYHACDMAENTEAKAIVTISHSGYSAIKVSSQRPRANIFIFTDDRNVLCKLNLVWGIRAYSFDKLLSTDHAVDKTMHIIKKEGFVKNGDLVVHIASTPLELKGMTNMIKLSKVN